MCTEELEGRIIKWLQNSHLSYTVILPLVLNYELSGIQYLLSLNFVQQDSLAEESDMGVVLLSIITAVCYSSLLVADAKNPTQVNLYK